MRITLDDVEYRYQVNTPFEHLALHDVNISMESGTYTAIIGHTGSGKSTLLQHLNALLKPTKGRVFIGDRTIEAGKKKSYYGRLDKRSVLFFSFRNTSYLMKPLKRIYVSGQ